MFALFMQRWRFRSLIELGLPPPGVELREVLPSAKEYAYFEGKDGRDKAFSFDLATTEDPGPEWICSNCKQPNPTSFDLCWKCNHRRAARRRDRSSFGPRSMLKRAVGGRRSDVAKPPLTKVWVDSSR